MRTLDEILQSTSDVLFPQDMGRRRVSIDSRDCDGNTPLHVLIGRGDRSGALALIEAGAAVNARGDMSLTPLHIAVSVGMADLIEALIVAGADPDLKSEFGTSPRDEVATKGKDLARAFARAERERRQAGSAAGRSKRK